MNGPPVGVVDILASSEIERFLAGQAQPPEAIRTPFESWNRECRDSGGGQGIGLGWHITIAGGTVSIVIGLITRI